MDVIIKAYPIDYINSNEELFNVGNLGSSKPADYELVLAQCDTKKWINSFHQKVPILEISGSELEWMKKAFSIGMITGNFPLLYTDELNELCNRVQIPFSGENGWFVRTEYVSLKCGVHGPGPYYHLKKIIESIVTSIFEHACITEQDTECRLYFIPWQNIDPDKEFRVFVHNGQVTAVSQQHLYQTNSWLRGLNYNQIHSIVQLLTDFCRKTVIPKITHVTSYTVDLALLDENKPYFIEINTFGASYAAGSSLFHWINDEMILQSPDTIEFRYAV